MVAPTLPPPLLLLPLLVLCYGFTSAFRNTGREEGGDGKVEERKRRKHLSNKSAFICLHSQFTFPAAVPALFVRETQNAGRQKKN